ncbi:molecular chaperone Tir [Pseudomonas granadensis]|uniref:molecular chaperone Tir n=1 Tax=Pseudomonas granadensis TaxID=1421430 RepID=UPI0019D03E7E|nr:molecular chaperone Tir [Pseudomonas granadensis]MBN6774203.1 molecular chaperone Tir [Pseudomonas granadensis]MBN6805323.1 molecular chaperone Tir [Pseudomonas granadensis]MBN6832229.1 molecular chaperone Tir [Pseudomonas granadensis]MBN6839517.1 molecular chaperone Tir [Pseudomonas granadensis]MBN6868652.1 molecular chaperone Tir [Pseudomonas granadensis]
MSYVGDPFVHDLFISYSHGYDEGLGVGHLQPWSAAFAKELEKELRAEPKIRNQLTIFCDGNYRLGQGVDPMAPLTEQLREHIGRAALLIILMSPDYLRSTWCADERKWWYEHQLDLEPTCKERIAVVRIWPTEDDPWPKLLTDTRDNPLVGFNFHAPIFGEERPLGWVDMPAFGSDFKKAILNIVARIYPKLVALKQKADERARLKTEIEKLSDDMGQTIYLHGRAEYFDIWQKAALALTDAGFSVTPGKLDLRRDPRDLQDSREQRVELMATSDAVLIIGTDDNHALDADLVVVGKHDRQSARARCNRLLPCGLLNTVGTDIATPVRKATARILQTDWLDATKEPWTDNIKHWLDEKSSVLKQRS